MITIENCQSLLVRYRDNPTGSITDQAAAWKVVSDFCVERGKQYDPKDDNLTGMQKMIKFLDQHLPKQ